MGGGDKPLVALGGRPLLSHILYRLAPQAGAVAINANGDAVGYRPFGLPILADSVAGNPGPLAGILAALDWAAAAGFTRVLTVPGDTPFLPLDLAARLGAVTAPAAIAASAGQRHPTVGLWPVRAREALRVAVRDEGLRRVEAWVGRLDAVAVDFAADPVDPFFNLNSPEDLAEAERVLGLER
jgi:molybdopterin-guanine dinucleotide biosynthesis protein A